MEEGHSKEQKIFPDEALAVINKLEFEDYEEFSYNGTNFLLILHSQEDIDGSGDNKEEVFFTRSTAIDGFDIYVLETLPVEEKKRRVFHEIVEADLRNQGFGEAAHDITKKTELDIFGESKSEKET